MYDSFSKTTGGSGPDLGHWHISITTPIAPAMKKLLYLGFSRISNGYFKPLLDPGGRFSFRSEAVISYTGNQKPLSNMSTTTRSLPPQIQSFFIVTPPIATRNAEVGACTSQ